jgi:hypothetical protein
VEYNEYPRQPHEEWGSHSADNWDSEKSEENAVEDAVGFQHYRSLYAWVEYKPCGVTDY